VVPVACPAAPAAASFPGRDGQIAYTRTDGFGNQTVWSVNPRTGAERQLTTVPEQCRTVRASWFDDVPAYSASGRRLFYSHIGDCGTRQAPAGLYRVPAAGGEGRLVLRDRKLRAPWWPVPTAGGRRLLFVNDLLISRRHDPDGYSNTIFAAFPGRGARTRRLSPRGATTEEFPAVSRSGRIAFARDHHQLVIGHPRRARVLTTYRRGEISTPDFSPDGRRVVFARDRHRRGFHSDIFRIGARGRGLRRLTRTDDAVSPVWSPSGRRIAFIRAPDDAQPSRGPLYVMSSRGRRLRRLLRGVDHTRLSWQRLR
jgi:dipeptidyl aminopeptidase/acylaminoacyl peptidase